MADDHLGQCVSRDNSGGLPLENVCIHVYFMITTQYNSARTVYIIIMSGFNGKPEEQVDIH